MKKIKNKKIVANVCFIVSYLVHQIATTNENHIREKQIRIHRFRIGCWYVFDEQDIFLVWA